MASRNLAPGSSNAGVIFIKSQFFSKPARIPTDTNLAGKIAIVTGASSGMGLECVCQLASFNVSRVIVAVRSIERGKAALTRTRARYPKTIIDVWPLDMTSYKSIQEFAQRVNDDLPHIDIAILNAGVIKTKFDKVPGTGHEEMLQVNYLSTVLLAFLLIPILGGKKRGGNPGRLTIVNSSTALGAKFQNRNETKILASFDQEKTFDGMETYGTTKLLAHLFLYKLVDYVSANDVVVNIVDPGFVGGTQLHRDSTGLAGHIWNAVKAVSARKLEVGVSTYLDASLVKGKASHGCYIQDWKIHPFAALVYTPQGKQITEKLWQETINELKFADVEGSLKLVKAS